jgi:hypothetical protein
VILAAEQQWKTSLGVTTAAMRKESTCGGIWWLDDRPKPGCSYTYLGKEREVSPVPTWAVLGRAARIAMVDRCAASLGADLTSLQVCMAQQRADMPA